MQTALLRFVMNLAWKYVRQVFYLIVVLCCTTCCTTDPQQIKVPDKWSLTFSQWKGPRRIEYSSYSCTGLVLDIRQFHLMNFRHFVTPATPCLCLGLVIIFFIRVSWAASSGPTCRDLRGDPGSDFSHPRRGRSSLIQKLAKMQSRTCSSYPIHSWMT